MALACLAAEAEPAATKLARQGYALLDGSDVDLGATLAAFGRLQAAAERPVEIPPEHPLVAALLDQTAVAALLAEALGQTARVVNAQAIDQADQLPVSWRQAGRPGETGLGLQWHLDLIGPADGALRVLPASHRHGRLSLEQIAALALELPALELPVSAGTVLAIDPLVVRGCRRRTTRGPRRVLQVELARA